jgi:dTDP-4-amino-4,6-dideoxygalactose transaminase
MAALSFNGNKIITTSGGGALVSKNKHYIDQARFLATQARDEAPHYQHSQIGYNYRMSNIVAGIGRGQMEVIDDRVTQRRANNQRYRDFFVGIDGITFQTEPDTDYYSNYWLTAILIDPAKTGGISREVVRLALDAENIESRPLWKPMHMQPVYEGSKFFGSGVCEKLFEQGLCLPSGSNLTEEEFDRIYNALSEIFKK